MPGEPGKFWQFKRFLARRMFHPYLVVTRDGVHIHGTSGTYLVQDHQELKPVAFEQRVVPVAEFEAKCVLQVLLPVQRLQTQRSRCTMVWLHRDVAAGTNPLPIISPTWSPHRRRPSTLRCRWTSISRSTCPMCTPQQLLALSTWTGRPGCVFKVRCLHAQVTPSANA